MGKESLEAGTVSNGAESDPHDGYPNTEEGRARRNADKARTRASIESVDKIMAERQAILAKLSREDRERLEAIDGELRSGSEHLV